MTDKATKKRDRAVVLEELREDPEAVVRLRTWLAQYGIITNDPVREPKLKPRSPNKKRKPPAWTRFLKGPIK